MQDLVNTKIGGYCPGNGAYLQCCLRLFLKYQRKFELNYQWPTALMENNRNNLSLFIICKFERLDVSFCFFFLKARS